VQLSHPVLLLLLRTGGNFCHQGCNKEIVKTIFRLSKPTDMTIHCWKALGEHFLMVPLLALVFQFIHFRGKFAFSEFSSKNLSLVRELIHVFYTHHCN
jgi:hypothetical protein